MMAMAFIRYASCRLKLANAASTGAKYKAEIIDTWNMTITPVAETFELAPTDDYRILDKQLKKIRLPMRPYLAIRLIRI